MNKFLQMIGAVVLVAIILTVFACLFAWPVKLLWNSTMPELFGLKVITFWQAMKLSWLCGFLFKSSSSSSK